MVKSKDLSRPLSVFQILFDANIIFKNYQDSPVYSSTFQACVNPVDCFPEINARNIKYHNT